MKKILILLVASLSLAFGAAQDSLANPADAAFSHFYVSIEGGEINPFGEVETAVYPAYFGGVGIRYTYWDDVDGFVHFNYSYFLVRNREIPFPGVHQFVGRLGLDWHIRQIRPLVLGAGFTCNWTRADSESSEHFDGPGGMLVDNETEFGYFVRANLPVWSKYNFNIGLNVLWEGLWTLPNRSNMLTVGLYLERRIW